MSKTAWYTGIKSENVAERVILLGDPSRAERLSLLLTNLEQYPVQRGLKCLSGDYKGTRITACVFGMGAPVASIVMHELFDLGARIFLRIGTAMSLPPAEIGEFVIAEAAYRGEGTSGAYAPIEYPAVADFELQTALRHSVSSKDVWHSGVFASFDGFYKEMYALDKADRPGKEITLTKMKALGIIAIDMETSALLTVARILGARGGCLCLVTVDSDNGVKIAESTLEEGERKLFAYALNALCNTPILKCL